MIYIITRVICPLRIVCKQLLHTLLFLYIRRNFTYSYAGALLESCKLFFATFIFQLHTELSYRKFNLNITIYYYLIILFFRLQKFVIWILVFCLIFASEQKTTFLIQTLFNLKRTHSKTQFVSFFIVENFESPWISELQFKTTEIVCF